MPDTSKTTCPLGADEDVRIARLLRAALGHDCPPGSCQDCGGVGLVPSISATSEAGRSLWRPCPTCHGDKRGGSA